MCDMCEHGAEYIHAKEDNGMASHGWYAHMVEEDPSYPWGFNYHTHGFEKTWNHPDIQIILPIGFEKAHAIAWVIADELKEGNGFEPGTLYTSIIKGYPVQFIEATECDRRVLRLVMPDKAGKFEDGANAPQFSSLNH